MLESSQLVAFAATTDLERARRFYEESLGLPLVSRSPVAYVFQAPPTTLRVTLVERVVVAPYTVLGWVVADIGNAVRELVGRGVEVAHFEGMDQDDIGVWSAPGGALVAWFKDPDGNILSVSQL